MAPRRRCVHIRTLSHPAHQPIFVKSLPRQGSASRALSVAMSFRRPCREYRERQNLHMVNDRCRPASPHASKFKSRHAQLSADATIHPSYSPPPDHTTPGHFQGICYPFIRSSHRLRPPTVLKTGQSDKRLRATGPSCHRAMEHSWSRCEVFFCVVSSHHRLVVTTSGVDQ